MTATRGARSRIGLASLLVAGAALVFVSTAEARVPRNLPLPRLRPYTADEVRPDATPKRGLLQLFKRQPVAPTPSRFKPAEQKALAGISAFFNSFQTMEGQFIQFGPQGQQSEGSFYISRPGKIRFHYRPPDKLDVIADGRNVQIQNGRLKTQETYPLSKTPLRYLLAKNVDLTSDKVVSSIRREPDLVAVVIVEKSAFASFKLTLIFDSKSYELRQWVVTDAQGLNTSTALYNTMIGKAPDPGLFKITYATP